MTCHAQPGWMDYEDLHVFKWEPYKVFSVKDRILEIPEEFRTDDEREIVKDMTGNEEPATLIESIKRGDDEAFNKLLPTYMEKHTPNHVLAICVDEKAANCLDSFCEWWKKEGIEMEKMQEELEKHMDLCIRNDGNQCAPVLMKYGARVDADDLWKACKLDKRRMYYKLGRLSLEAKRVNSDKGA